MNVVDARQYYWTAPFDDPLHDAPEDVIAGWIEVANAAHAELTQFGLPATVLLPAQNSLPGPEGMQIAVHGKRPFGVELNWEPPLTRSVEYTEMVIRTAPVAASGTPPLLKYVTRGSEAMLEAGMAILSAAGFDTTKDLFERQTYFYRVLAAPTTPIIERG